MKLTSKQRKALETVKEILESQPLTPSYMQAKGNSYTTWVNDFVAVVVGRNGQARVEILVPKES